MKQQESYHLRIAEAEEVIGQPPSWLLYWGISIILGLILMMGAATHFIYYPDQVQLPVIVAAPGTIHPLAPIRTAHLARLLVEEGQAVAKGQPVAYLGNEDNVQAALALEHWLSSITSARALGPPPPFTAAQDLGDLQEAYDHFYQALVLDQHTEQRAYLITRLTAWKRTHCLLAPASGSVRVVGFPQRGQVMPAEQALLYVESTGAAPVAEICLPVTLHARVSPGQMVRVSLDRYPEAEFGYLEGHVERISVMPTAEGTYPARISLRHGMVTNIHQHLDLHGSMGGKASIILVNKRLSERLWQSWQHALQK